LLSDECYGFEIIFTGNLAKNGVLGQKTWFYAKYYFHKNAHFSSETWFLKYQNSNHSIGPSSITYAHPL
jgi:hypothetical protein